MENGRILVTCAKGISPFLLEELLSLGYPVLTETVAGVSIEGTLEDAMTLNMCVRSGHRVLFHLASFTAGNQDDLYRGVSEIIWENYLHKDGYFCVTSSVDNPTIRDARFANLKCKDAIVDRMRKQCGMRPDSGPARDRTVVHLHWKSNECSLYLDTSGEPLSRRGYRKLPHKAPMQETLAASVILATGWHGQGNFVNPMCGSGTLAIEAALIASKKPPGLLRSNYGFMHLKGFNGARWKELRTRAGKAAEKTISGRIVATDIDPAAVEAAVRNAIAAGVRHLIEFGTGDYADTPIPDGGGVIVFNPGYGERIGMISGLEKTYKGIGDFLKRKCPGYTGYVFTGNADLAKKIGLRPKSKLPFFNGPIACRLLGYELYEGGGK